MGNSSTKGSKRSSRSNSKGSRSSKNGQITNSIEQNDCSDFYDQYQQNSLSFDNSYNNSYYPSENFKEDLVSETRVKVDSESNKY